MKRNHHYKPPGFFRTALALLTLAILAFTLPQGAEAGTSANASLYNSAKVTYRIGANTYFSTGTVTVTVSGVYASPVVTATAQTTPANTATTVNFTVRAANNGIDRYSTSALNVTAVGVSAAGGAVIPANVDLWAGYAVSSGAGYINIPFGTNNAFNLPNVAGPVSYQLAAGATVELNGNRYSVASFTPGSAASTDVNGDLVAEVPTRVNLTPILASPPITAATVTVGTPVQVGEYKTLAVTYTSGIPAVVGVDGTHVTTFTLTSSGDNTKTAGGSQTTTVVSPNLSVVKSWRNDTVGAGSTFAAPGTRALPGDTIEYRVVVTNNSTTSAVSNANLIDAGPAYTSYVANSTRLNGKTVLGDGATSPLAGGGLAIDDDNPVRAAGAAATGNIAIGASATINYKVTIQ